MKVTTGSPALVSLSCVTFRDHIQREYKHLYIKFRTFIKPFQVGKLYNKLIYGKVLL